MKKVISLVLVILTLFSVMSLSVSAADKVTLCKIGEHDWYQTDKTKPTCSSKGYIQYSCKNCYLGTKSEAYAEQLPHTDENHDGVCDICRGDSTAGCKCKCHIAHRADANATLLIPSVFFSVVAYIFRQIFKINHYCECGFYEIYK